MVARILVLFIALALIGWAAWPRKQRPVFMHPPETPASIHGELSIKNGGTGTIEPYVPVECTEDNHGMHCKPIETVAQRFIRLQKEWIEADAAARDERTPLREKADALFKDFIAAQNQLERENKQ